MQQQRLGSSVLVVISACLLGVAPVRAASLQKVEQATWGVGGLPAYVHMYVYVPDKLAPRPPILVSSHHCGGTAMSTYNETKATFVSLADKNGFVIIMPEATGHNCWDVGSAKSLRHDGGGDTHAVAQMVRYALSKYNGDASRVYAFGTSSGAMMTQALLGVYPDMFVAGVAVAGVPCGCWAADYTGDSGANPQWSGPCAGGNVSKSAAQWGDQVRAMFPGYAGHRPRVQLWHGTADTTISFKNLAEAVKEWTNLLGLSEQSSASDSARSGYMHQTWKNACGYVSLETWAQQGAGHGVSWDGASAATFLGLDVSRAQDPEAVECPIRSAAGGATGSAGSAAGGFGGGPSSLAAGSAAPVAGRMDVAQPADAGRGPVAAMSGRSASTNAVPQPTAAANGAGAHAPTVAAPAAVSSDARAPNAGSSATTPASPGVPNHQGCSVTEPGASSDAGPLTLLCSLLALLMAQRRRTKVESNVSAIRGA